MNMSLNVNQFLASNPNQSAAMKHMNSQHTNNTQNLSTAKNSVNNNFSGINRSHLVNNSDVISRESPHKSSFNNSNENAMLAQQRLNMRKAAMG